MSIPPEIVREIIKVAPFEVVCAFAKCSKEYMAFCKNQARIRASEWLTNKILIEMRSQYVFPNGTKHGIYRMSDKEYIKYDLGVKMYIVRYKRIAFATDQYLLSTSDCEDFKSIIIQGRHDDGYIILGYVHNELCIDFEYICHKFVIKADKPYTLFDETYGFLNTLNIKDFVEANFDDIVKMTIDIRSNSHFIVISGKITTILEYLPNNDIRKTKNKNGIVSPEIKKMAIDGIPNPEIREFMRLFARVPEPSFFGLFSPKKAILEGP